ncbi:MerR family transcriptional regulator [Neobacillus sp. PS3-34]|uniref:MerR family transcriptional regulator n=1 Tax=Neobacillus sp. PS3-34 TaxID=3070678 RepID=UPI0027E1F805|nr:MerR family transcriptional regulator [Neobacillus sp. PS3-34]WML48044.1 MerR family transcriptional regulator [Neobacillus sp. PS3-34]
MKESTFLRAHTIKEVSKIIQVPTGTIRQWEKDLTGLLNIPRTKQGARYYTETEISLLLKIKQMREKNLGKEMIRELLEKHKGQHSVHEASESFGTEISPVIEVPTNHQIDSPTPDIYAYLETYKESLLNEIRQLRNGVRKEFVEEVRKEISKSTMQTVKSLSDSIYKSTEKTKDEIKSLSNQLASLRNVLPKQSERFHKVLQSPPNIPQKK